MNLRALPMAIAAAAVAATAAAITLAARGPAGSAPPASGACAGLVVPAYFAPPEWARAAQGRPPPGEMILDISGVGAGTAPSATFRAMVGQARAAGVTVLGYVSTVDGRCPLAADEAEVRNYAAWYGVRSVFLDRVSGQPAELGYYRRLAATSGGPVPAASCGSTPGCTPTAATCRSAAP